MKPSERPTSSRLNALTELLRNAVQEPSGVELQHGLRALETRTALTRTRPRTTLRWALTAALLMSSLVLAWAGASFFAKPPSISDPPVAVNEIEGGQLLEGGYLSETGRSGITLFFNEGSEFQLDPGTRGRLRGVTSAGARLSIEHGTASFDITQSKNHRWEVEAGPFVVTVRGTKFEVTWDPKQERLEVSLKRGRVVVSGPVVGNELVLQPGQTLTVSLPERQSLIQERRTGQAARTALDPEAGSARTTPDSEGAPPASASGEPEVSRSVATQGSPSPSSEGERSWREAIATGQWDRILAEVDGKGARAILGTLSSENLLALADAARYRRRADLARAALVEQRRRFPDSLRSLDALFLLGRVEEGQGGKQLAIRRYDEYLARAPGGTYAAEALGRRMVLTKDTEGPESAARIAERYLRRFPNGSYAEAARALRQVP